MMTETLPEILWSPDRAQLENSNLTRFMNRVGLGKAGEYDELWRWSVTHPAEFWTHLWEHAGVIGEGSCQPAMEE